MNDKNKIKVAIVGMGNVGKKALEAALLETDMEVVGIVSKSITEKVYKNIPVFDDVFKIKQVDVAIICSPSRNVEETAIPILEKGICTVDSFDIHSKIISLQKQLKLAAQKGGSVSIISSGWDPGSDSIVRALMLACAPKGITNTNFGPGMSMGHSVAAKKVKGVIDALSITIPEGGSVHKRMVYVQLGNGADFEQISKAIKADDYFSKDETIVKQVDDIDKLKNASHGVNLVRHGVSGTTNNQRFEFNMTIDNPALTSQIMVSCARAAVRQKSGCYTMIEIPPIDFLQGERENLINTLV